MLRADVEFVSSPSSALLKALPFISVKTPSDYRPLKPGTCLLLPPKGFTFLPTHSVRQSSQISTPSDQAAMATATKLSYADLAANTVARRGGAYSRESFSYFSKEAKAPKQIFVSATKSRADRKLRS